MNYLSVINDKTGEQIKIDQKDLNQAIQDGFRLETDDEIKKRVMDKAYEGPGSQLLAGAAGAARGLSFGISDVIGEPIISKCPPRIKARLRRSSKVL